MSQQPQQQPQRPARRISSLPVIAIDRIRAVARPDQLLGHREGEPRGLQVANADELQLFDLDDDDPILLECMARQAEQEKLEQERKQASRMQWTTTTSDTKTAQTQATLPMNTKTNTKTKTKTNTQTAIHDNSPGAIDAADSNVVAAAAAASEKSTATTAREDAGEKLPAAMEMSPLRRRLQQNQNDKLQQENELSDSLVPFHAPPVGPETAQVVEKRGPSSPGEKVDDAPSPGSDMDMSKDEESLRSKRPWTTAAAVDTSTIYTMDATAPSSTNNAQQLSFANEDSMVCELEKKYMQMLDDDIIALEEKELMEKLDREICAAEKREALEKKRDSLVTSTSSSLVRPIEAVESKKGDSLVTTSTSRYLGRPSEAVESRREALEKKRDSLVSSTSSSLGMLSEGVESRPVERSSIALESSPPERTRDSTELEPLGRSKALQGNAMRVYDDAAIALEEKEWMAKLDQEICAAEQREKENAAAERLSRPGVLPPAKSGRPEQPRQATTDDPSSQRQPSSVLQVLAKSGVLSPGDSRKNSRYVKASKLIPRYLEGDPTRPFITQLQFQETLVAPFVAVGKDRSGEWSGFTAELNVVPDDPSSWLLTVKGRSKAVDYFRSQLQAWVTDNLKAFNFALLLKNGVDCEVEIDRSKAVGAMLSEVKDLDDSSQKAGLLIANKSEQGQLGLALGLQATKCGAAVLQVDGASCTSITEFKKQLGKESGEKLLLVLRLHQDADLSESLRSVRSELPNRLDDSPISAAPSKPAVVADHTPVVHLPDVAKNSISSTMQKDSDQERLEGLESNETLIDRLDSPQESESGSVTAQVVNGKSTESLPPVATGKQKKASFHLFDKKFKEAAELEFKGSGIHLKFVIGQMWQQHKQKYGITCSDDCRCVFDLPFLTKNVIWEKLKAESKKPDSKWSDTFHLRVGDEHVGFLGRFAAKFIPRLQKEYHDDNSPEMLNRLIAMWELHRRNRNFGLVCKESCECSEGWDLTFRRGLIPSDNKVEIAPRTGLGRNDSRRSSLDSGPLKRTKAAASGSTSLIDQQTPSTENLIEGSGNPRAEDASNNRKLPGRSESESVRAVDEEGESSATVVSSKTLASGDGRLSTANQTVSSLDDHRRNTSAREISINKRQSESGSSSHELSGITNRDVPESFRGVPRQPVYSSTTGSRKEYDVTFDTQKPLGFFCCTDKEQQSGVTSCTIFSVSPCGQCSAEPRIQKGTTIRAVLIGGGRYPITSFQDIRNYYNRAAAERSNLRIWFLNEHVTASYMHPSTIFDDDWASTGQWRGKHSPGWAGGARVVTSLSVSPPTGKRIREVPTHNDSLVLPGQARRTAIAFSSVSPPDGKRIRHVPTHNDALTLPGQARAAFGGGSLGIPDSKPEPEMVLGTDEWVILDTVTSTPVHSQPSGSSLKKSVPTGEEKRTRKVCFTDGIDERQFRKESRSYQFLVKSTGIGALPATSRISNSAVELSSRGTTSRELELFDCIRRGGIEDMLRLLVNGALVDSRPGKGLEQMHHHLKREVSTCDKQCALYPADRQLKSNKIDLDLKYLLLKIYINAAQIEHIARSLKNWVRFQIVIDRIETRLSPFAEIEGGQNVLSAGVIANYDSTTGKDLIALPPKPLSSCISYEVRNVYHLNHNTSITPERALTIHLRNELENGFSPIFLGPVNIPLSRLLGKCPKAGGWCVIEEEASPNRLLLSGKVVIRARRVALEPGYVDKKRNGERQRMKQTIKMVAGFNKELSEKGNSQRALPPNVTVYGGTSLLHSAVFLEDERLVKTLLDLGADIYAKGVGGQSAVALALNMADGVVEKTAGEDMTSGSQMEAEIDDWRKARRARVDAVSKLLHDHVHLTPDNEKEAEKSNTNYSKGDNHHERVHRQVAANVPVAGVADSSIPSPTTLPPSQDEMNSSAKSMHDVRLPTDLDRDWIFGVDQSVQKAFLCRQYERTESCFHNKCKWYHVKFPPGLDFPEIAARETKGRDGMYSAAWTGSLSSFYKAFYKTSVSSDNTRWFTAVLMKTRFFRRDIFYATGPPGFRGDDGTYWYRSEAEAKRSLKNILVEHYESECVEAGIPWTPPWKQDAPTTDEAQTKYADGKAWCWCGVCSRWIITHDTNPSGDIPGHACGWKSVAPATDEAQTKFADGKPYHWCGICCRWCITHGTIARGDIPGHEDCYGSSPKTKQITESNGSTDFFRTDSAAAGSQTLAPRGYSADGRSESLHLGTRKRELHADNPYEPSPKRQAMPPSSRDAGALPELRSRNWLGKPGAKLCTFFNTSKSCRHGRSCHFEHVQDPLPLSLLEPPPTVELGRLFALIPKAKGPEFMHHAHIKKAPGGWVTAGYRNDDLNEIYYSEGSGAGVKNRQGIWWYPNADSAQSALQRVMLAATLRREKSFNKPRFLKQANSFSDEVAGGKRSRKNPSSEAGPDNWGSNVTNSNRNPASNVTNSNRNPAWDITRLNIPQRHFYDLQNPGPVDICRKWHLNGSCNTSCPRKDSHKVLHGHAQQAFTQWFDSCK